MLTPVRIGAVTVDPPVFLAPMAGYTDTAMRTLCREFGCGAVLTEVTNAAGLVHNTFLTWHLLDSAESERPVGAHIYGSDTDVVARAAELIHKTGRFDFIDLNCGCPVRKIMAKGSGAALINEPRKIQKLLRTIADAVPMPVTVKTRIGKKYGDGRFAEVLAAAEAGGASVIFLHARYAANQHRGEADWAMLADAVKRCRIPVIGNGGIKTAEDVFRMIRETGVQGVMIGRAAVGNPWIFEQVRSINAGGKPALHSLDTHRRVMAEHLQRLHDLKRREPKRKQRDPIGIEQATVLHFRSHLYRYLAGFRHWVELRRELNNLHTIEELLSLVDRVFERQPGPDAPPTGGLVPVVNLV